MPASFPVLKRAMGVAGAVDPVRNPSLASAVTKKD
jgi:hypothetical protein